MTQPFTIEPARPEDLAPAFRLIFRHVPGAEREVRVANALELVHQKILDPAGLRVARGGRALLGAVICTPVAGAGGIIWPPQAAVDAGRIDIEDRLVEAALHWLREHGAKLAQCLLAPHEVSLGSALERNGFQHVTDLWYMRHALAAAPAPSPETLTYQTYDACDHEIFHQTLLRTYDDTLDCPEVNGVRTIDEVIGGHRNQGVHDPQLWWLACSGDEPVGVVLLTAMPEWSGWDLIYLGVVKPARGRGLGRELTGRALVAARRAGQRQLTLSVDVRNQPAWALYRAAGFASFDRRAVYLSIWRS